MRKTPWQHLRANPPAYCFLMARRKINGNSVRAIPLQEVAIASGLSLSRVTAISWQDDWVGVDLVESERYLAGCNYDPLNPNDRNRVKAYIRACKIRKCNLYAYLKRSPNWEKEYLPRINLLRSSSQRKSSDVLAR